MNSQAAVEKIRNSFPDVRVLLNEGLFTHGLGVEFIRDGVPVRNAYLVKDDHWIEAADKLIGWLQREKP